MHEHRRSIRGDLRSRLRSHAGKAHGGLSGPSWGPPDPPRPKSKNLKAHTFCRALSGGRVSENAFVENRCFATDHGAAGILIWRAELRR